MCESYSVHFNSEKVFVILSVGNSVLNHQLPRIFSLLFEKNDEKKLNKEVD